MVYKSFILIFTIFSLMGCSTKQIYVKAYSGETLVDTKKLALLKPEYGISIVSIDNEFDLNLSTVEQTAVVDAEIGLSPGNHIVIFYYYTGTFSSNTNKTLKFTAKAGHRYLLRPGAPRGLVFGAATWAPYIVDVTAKDKNECWTLYAGDCG